MVKHLLPFLFPCPSREIDPTELPQDAEASSEQVHHKVFKTNRPEIKNDISVIPDTTKNGLLLIVDDDPDICELLKEFLTEKYEIAIAEMDRKPLN